MDLLSPSDPICKLYHIVDNEEKELVGTTEMILNNENPKFKEHFSVCFYFERHQPMKVECYDQDGSGDTAKFTLIGEVCFELSEVM